MISQVLQPSQVEQEILTLKKEIARLRLLGTSFFSPEVNELRSVVLDAHADGEEMLVSIIVKHLYTTAHTQFKHQGFKSFGEFRKRVELIIDGTYIKLARRALDLGIIDEMNFLDLKMLNDIRVVLAHPRDGRWKQFLEEEKYKWALEEVIKVTMMLATIDREFGLASE